MNRAEKFWNKHSARFEKQVEKDEKEFAEILAKIKKYFNPEDKVLDFACGIGTSSFHIIDYVKEVKAFDISSGMIDIAKKRMNNVPDKNIEFITTTLFDEQFKNETFDVVTAFNIMHLLENPKEEIRRIYQLLKPGGLFISSSAFLGEKSNFRFIFYLMSKTGFVPHLKLLKIVEFEKIIASENFNILETDKANKPTPYALMVAKKK